MCECQGLQYRPTQLQIERVPSRRNRYFAGGQIAWYPLENQEQIVCFFVDSRVKEFDDRRMLEFLKSSEFSFVGFLQNRILDRASLEQFNSDFGKALGEINCGVDLRHPTFSRMPI